MAMKSIEQRAKSKELKIKRKKQASKSKGYTGLCSLLFALCFVLVSVGGCASFQQKEAVLAVVNGETITEGDLRYSLTVAHRREDLSSAGALNLSQFIQKMVDDKLIIQEARRMGAEDYPEVQQSLQAYILRESVVRLYDEEIVRKVTVTEEEVKNYYIRNYKKSPDEGLERVKGSIERAIRKQKEKERSDEYLKLLRKQTKIQIDNELLQAINVSEESEREKLSKDERILVQIDGVTITAGNFISVARAYPGRSKEQILNDWIDQKVVDKEALSRHYEKMPELENMVARYKNQLLKNTYIKRVVIPQVALSDEELKNYYATHQESFTKPEQFKIQQITVKTMDDAQNILNNLQNGADFSWLAKNRSVDSAASEGGALGWVNKAEMPEPLRKIVDTLKPGNISPVVKIDSQYRIIQLLDRKEGEVEDFDKVKAAVYRAAFEEQVNTLLNNYIAQLKKDAVISVNYKEVRMLEEKLGK